MESKNILVTGAMGNIGTEILRGLKELNTHHRIVVADYLPEDAQPVKDRFGGYTYRRLDFSQPGGFDAALQGIDIVFLLRPPQLADVKKYFDPFLAAMKRQSITKVVFLSVQGVENQSLIPHHKLEKLIVADQMEFVFLRPSYFMQNLTTTLLHDIQQNRRIFVPSGPLKFNWVDARDIGLVGAHVLHRFDDFKNQALEITGSDFAGFDEVVRLINKNVRNKIRYVSPNLLRFF
ncbi:MAG: NmrA family NAD(P)-binding protein, partial [Bacteroidota bacterium]